MALDQDLTPTPSAEDRLTDLEAHVLSQVVANEPLTTFEIMKIYSKSPVSGLSGSPGAIYPTVKRLKARGLITAEAVQGSARKIELLRSTEAGQDLARSWIGSVLDNDLLPHDPMRSKISFMGLLTKIEQMRFLVQAKRAMESKLAEVEAYASNHVGPYADLAFDCAKSTLESRIRWLDATLLKIAES